MPSGGCVPPRPAGTELMAPRYVLALHLHSQMACTHTHTHTHTQAVAHRHPPHAPSPPRPGRLAPVCACRGGGSTGGNGGEGGQESAQHKCSCSNTHALSLSSRAPVCVRCAPSPLLRPPLCPGGIGVQRGRLVRSVSLRYL